MKIIEKKRKSEGKKVKIGWKTRNKKTKIRYEWRKRDDNEEEEINEGKNKGE